MSIFLFTVFCLLTRLSIPIYLRDGTAEYFIPPITSLRSFSDLELWLVEFFKKFELRPGESSDTMLLKPVNPEQTATTDQRSGEPMTYEIESLLVQAWSTMDEARAFFAVFAPPKIPLAVLQVLLFSMDFFSKNQLVRSSVIVLEKLSL